MEKNSCKLIDRKGKLIIDRRILLESDASVLREIFSNFFPIAIETTHRIDYFDSVVYHGISPHFEKVDKVGFAPYYYVQIHTDSYGTVKFDKMVKV